MEKNKHQAFLQVYGDSLTEGFPGKIVDSWPTLLSTYLGVGVIQTGQNGRLLAEMNQEKEEWLGNFHTLFVTLMGGTNDFYQRRPVEETLNHMKKIVSWVVDQGRIPVVCLPPPCQGPYIESGLAEFRRELQSWCEVEKIHLLDFNKEFYDEKGQLKKQYFADLAHPNKEGYEAMAKQAEIYFKNLEEYKVWENRSYRSG